jgi:hypothetical protein
MNGSRSGPRAPRPQTVAEARAEVEARRAETKAARRAELDAAFPGATPGRPTLVVSWVATVVQVVVTVVAAVDPDAAIAPFFVVMVLWFFLGTALFVVDLVLAAARSRDDLMGIGGLFFLAGSAPPAARLNLLGSLALSTVTAVAGAAVRPFTPLAFGVLAPMLPLALCGWWAVRHGRFPAAPTR